jgi:hypothetical protein
MSEKKEKSAFRSDLLKGKIAFVTGGGRFVVFFFLLRVNESLLTAFVHSLSGICYKISEDYLKHGATVGNFPFVPFAMLSTLSKLFHSSFDDGFSDFQSK